jgi:intron-binding protein aquarius
VLTRDVSLAAQTLHDYLYRNLNLFRLESTFEIREDVVDSAKRMPARLDADGNIQFDGYVKGGGVYCASL